MATAEDYQHTQRLLKKYKGRLRVRELQKATLGDAADPVIDLEIDDLRASIAQLMQHDPSEIQVETQQALRKTYDSDIEFLIADGASRNRRQTRMEEKADGTAAELHTVKEWVLDLREEISKDKRSGAYGRLRNLVLLLLNVALLLVAIGMMGYLIRIAQQLQR